MEQAHLGMLGMDRSSRRYSRCGGSSPWRAFARPLGAHTATPVKHCASAFFGQPISVSNDVLEVAETVSARRVLVIRARPFRYAVVTLVATAERRGPRRNTASIRCWVRRIIDVMVRLTEAGCELRYTLPQGLKLRSSVCASHPT